MARISDVVNLKTGYANFVELKSDFEASQENAERMAMYRPTQAHRKAFERICRGLYQPNDKKFYLLSGSYGTGKSHLCLMTANFLSRSSGDPEIAGFYDNYERLDPDQAKRLRNIRRDGQYLVAICDYHSGGNFEDVVMRAVFEACAAKGLDAGVETRFDEAERQLVEWEAKGEEGGLRNFYQDFGQALAEAVPGLTVGQLRAGLKNYEATALAAFETAFKATTGGVRFQPQAGNLIPILQKLIRSQAFKKRFKGLAVFFDEFGFTLEKGLYSKEVLQGFMETICQREPNVMFVGCIHKDFKSYADRLSQADAAVMDARKTQVDLLNEGVEEIIGAIVETDRQSTAWAEEIAPKTGVFDQLLPYCTTLNLFPWIINKDHIRQRVLEDIYGVHPMALSCLLKLSSEIGSDARSTFTFFSGEVGGDEGSYADFIQTAELTVRGGKLNLYTVDQLADFFSKELSLKNPELRERQRQAVNGFHASLDALRKGTTGELTGFFEDERIKVLRTILVYELCQIPTNLENIQFGLYCLSNTEKKQVQSYLNDLVKTGAVFLRQQSKTYELAASSGEDPYDLIERFLNDPGLHPSDPVAAFLEEAADKDSLGFAAAKGYNLPFSEDKHFRTRFVPAKDLGDGLWAEIREDYAQSRQKPSQSFEGTLVYVLCENETEIKRARDAAQSISENNLALAVPHKPRPFTDILLKVKACRHYLPPDEAQAISAQTESRLRDILDNPDDGYLPVLERLFRDIAEGSDSCWYSQEGRVLVDRPKQSHRAADMLCEQLFTQRSRIKHPDLNLCHDDKWRTGKNTALKQAVKVLLEADRVMIDNGNPDNHGEKRYLEKVLLRGAGALAKSGSEGVVSFFHCETDPTRISADLPVLRMLCTRLAALESDQTLALGAFLEEASAPPYGAGGTLLVLALAHVLRGYGERLIVYKDSTRMVEQPLTGYDDLVDIVSDPAAQAVLAVRHITTSQEVLVDQLARAVGAPPLKHGETRSITAAFQEIETWWRGLPSVARIVSLYPEEHRTQLTELKNLMSLSAGSIDRFNFLLEQLPAVYNSTLVTNALSDADAQAIGDAFKQDVELLNTGQQLAEHQVAEAVCQVFEVQGDGDLVECEKAVTEWYKSLNPSQREPARCNDEDASQFLTRLADNYTSLSAKLVSLLPKDYGFGPVREWSSLHVQDFAAKLKQAKTEIDTARPVVNKPVVHEGSYEVRDSEEMYVAVPDGADHLLYTVDEGDPKHSTTALRTAEKLDLVPLLDDRRDVTVTMRAVDPEGNMSDAVRVQLVNLKRKYGIEVESDLFGEKEASFKCPDDKQGFVAVLKSVIKFGVDRDLLSPQRAEKFETLLNELAADEP
jgi:hypothetical protein